MATKARRQPGEGGLFKDGRGYWTASVTLPPDPANPEKRRRKVVRSKQYEVARKKLRALLNEQAQYGDLLAVAPLFPKWADEWLNMPSVKNLKPKTWDDYERNLRLYATPYFKKKKVDQITPRLILNLYAAMQAPKDKGGKGLSPTTVAGCHRVLSKCLKDAKNIGIIRTNPAERIKPPRPRATQKLTITAEQAAHFLSHHANRPYVARYLVGLMTGERQGEVLGLEADRLTFYLDPDGTPLDVDMELAWALQRLTWQHGCTNSACGYVRAASCPQRFADIPANHEAREAYRGLWLLRPKTRSSWRVVKGGPLVARVLARYLNGRTEGFVFQDEDGHPIDPRVDWEIWNQWLEEAGLPRMGIHSQRHTASTLLAVYGADEKMRMDMMGHSSASTNRIYTRGDQSGQLRVLTALGEALDFNYQPTEDE